MSSLKTVTHINDCGVFNLSTAETEQIECIGYHHFSIFLNVCIFEILFEV